MIMGLVYSTRTSPFSPTFSAFRRHDMRVTPEGEKGHGGCGQTSPRDQTHAAAVTPTERASAVEAVDVLAEAPIIPSNAPSSVVTQQDPSGELWTFVRASSPPRLAAEMALVTQFPLMLSNVSSACASALNLFVSKEILVGTHAPNTHAPSDRPWGLSSFAKPWRDRCRSAQKGAVCGSCITC